MPRAKVLTATLLSQNRRSLDHANVSQCAASNGGSNALLLTSVTGQRRGDGRGASEETFHVVRHVVDAWGGAEARWEIEAR